ncbi:hypothetical protein [Nostoc sp. GT001]|uniref:hypothetical protein n=1 Tax=Nostoc sp. GT001 TaxID=3056647 RepID=UPI0025AAC2CC|nr:hypothetical protein [Nostoc sp. GT001]MDM9583714.1 hypothetical protein [Nostoc sp. GT001]
MLIFIVSEWVNLSYPLTGVRILLTPEFCFDKSFKGDCSREAKDRSDFSRDLENPSPNLSPTRREALISPPSLQGKGAGGLGFPLAFPHDVKTQEDRSRKPGDCSREPGDRSCEPKNRSREPGDRSREPGDRSREPGDCSREPGDCSREPGDRSREPKNRSHEPGDRSREPGDRSREPEDRSREPKDCFSLLGSA